MTQQKENTIIPSPHQKTKRREGINQGKNGRDPLGGTNFFLDLSMNAVKKFAKIIYQIDRIRTEHRPLHEHLMKMIRFTNEEVMRTKDGLPLKNLEAGVAGEIFMKATKPWVVMNTFNKLGIGRMVALHSYQGIINSSGVGLFIVSGSDAEDFLKGGQALERIWLTLNIAWR